MNCQEVEGMITDLARGVEGAEQALAHVRECRRCGERLVEEERLNAGLLGWAAASVNEQAPNKVEEKLIEAFRRSHTPTRRRWLPVAAAGAIAAATILLLKLYSPAERGQIVAPPPAETARLAPAVPIEPAPIAPRRVKVRAARRAVRLVPAQSEMDFLPVAQGDGWTPLDGGRLVRVELPRSALRVFGLPMNEERAQEQIQADVMLSNDGLLRAIRFVR